MSNSVILDNILKTIWGEKLVESIASMLWLCTSSLQSFLCSFWLHSSRMALESTATSNMNLVQHERIRIMMMYIRWSCIMMKGYFGRGEEGIWNGRVPHGHSSSWRMMTFCAMMVTIEGIYPLVGRLHMGEARCKTIEFVWKKFSTPLILSVALYSM